MNARKWGKKTIALVLALLMLFDQGKALFAPISAEESVLPAEQQEVRIEPVDLVTDATPAEVAADPQAAPTATEENTVADSAVRKSSSRATHGESIGAGGEDITMPATQQDAPIATNTRNVVLGGDGGEGNGESGNGQESPTLSIPLVAGPLSSDSAVFAPEQCTLSVEIPAPGSYVLVLSVPNDNEIEYLSIDSVLTDETGGAVAWLYFYVQNYTYENWQTGEMMERHIKNVAAFFTAPSAGTYTLQINRVFLLLSFGGVPCRRQLHASYHGERCLRQPDRSDSRVR